MRRIKIFFEALGCTLRYTGELFHDLRTALSDAWDKVDTMKARGELPQSARPQIDGIVVGVTMSLFALEEDALEYNEKKDEDKTDPMFQ